MQELASMSALELVNNYKTKVISPVEVINSVFSQIDSYQPTLNAFTFIDRDGALRDAKISEKRWLDNSSIGPLDGVPATIKDLIFVIGWPTRKGSRVTDPDISCTEDAPATARLREAGCILIGKTTTPEFGWKGVTDSSLSGTTLNPWNIKMTPGGSSGGAAVAAAVGMGALHIGTDGGGSIRIPASFTGVFGFKPTYGLVPAWPASPFGSLAHVGPITKTVADAATMLTAISNFDSRDWQAQPYVDHDFFTHLDHSIKDLRIAYSPNLGYAKVDLEVETIISRQVQLFSELGAVVELVDPGFHSPLEIFNMHWYAGAANLLQNFDSAEQELIDPGLVEIAREGTDISLIQYLASTNARNILAETMNAFHQKWDLLITPTLPTTAFPSNQAVPDPSIQKRWPDWTPFTYPFNLTQQPASSVPCGFTAAGLPVGLQIIGPKFSDKLVLRAAHAFESLCPFVMPDQDIVLSSSSIDRQNT